MLTQPIRHHRRNFNSILYTPVIYFISTIYTSKTLLVSYCEESEVIAFEESQEHMGILSKRNCHFARSMLLIEVDSIINYLILLAA